MLFDKELLVVNPKLAVLIGLNEAIILQQMHYWIKKSDKCIDGKIWIYNSITSWKEQFPFFSESTVKRTITELEKKGLILVGNFNKDNRDRTKWYSINYGMLQKLEDSLKESVNNALGQNDPCNGSKCPDSLGQFEPTITRDYTDTNNNTPSNPPQGEQVGDEKENTPTKKTSPSITLKTYLKQCEDQGIDAIPQTDTVFKNAQDAGLPLEFVALAWDWFKEYHSNGKGKDRKQKDWRAHFRNSVNGVWAALWWYDATTGEYKLTSKAHQFKNRIQAQEEALC